MLTQILYCIRLREERERQAQLRGPPNINRDEAATRIQKVSPFIHPFTDSSLYPFIHLSQVWRGFYQRKQVAEMRAQELVFLGMVRLNYM